MAQHAEPEPSFSRDKIYAREVLKFLKYFGLYGLYCAEYFFGLS